MSNELVLASDRLSTALGIQKDHMILTIKAQCFKGISPDRVSDTQLAAYVQVSQALMAKAPSFNPMLPGFLYAYPERNGGITPIIGPDGIFALLASHSEIEGWTTKFETIDGDLACTATIKHKRLGSISKTCFLTEWQVDSNPNWKARPKHMLEIRTLKHAARQCVHGIPMDSDEFEISKKNRGFENALPVEEAGEGSAATEPPIIERPKRKAGVAGAKNEATPAKTEEAVPANAETVLSAPPRQTPAENPTEKVAPAATVTKPTEPKAEEIAAAFPTKFSELKFPCTIGGYILSADLKKRTKATPEYPQGRAIAPISFKPEGFSEPFGCYSYDVANPVLLTPPTEPVEFSLEMKPQRDATKPALVMVTAMKAVETVEEETVEA